MTEKDLLETVSAGKWKGLGTRKRCGAVVPLASVYSSRSTGIADLRDIDLLVDWCSSTGNSILQLLPMNELGPVNCPYDSISSFALEPMYLSLNSVAGADSKFWQGRLAALKESFACGKGRVDYRIKEEKLKVLWEIFETSPISVSEDFEEYARQQAYWLDDFVLFKVLKNFQQGKAWWEWDPRYRDRDLKAIKDFVQEHQRHILFQKWLQWQLFDQFKLAKAYARKKNVLMKGDLPILVSRDSADVWAHPEYFKLDFIAGAPPDMYCAKGQRWGTSTYNWEKIFSDAGRYLKAKLVYAQNFYDILRIDHVVGLFRIWSIPVDEPDENKGLHGFFDPQEESTWEAHGKRILSFMLENTDMLLCAEDLGVIPPVCPKTLKEFGIPGNDVQRWTKDWEKRFDFLPPEEYRFLTVSMLSTHDTTNWPAWWENEAGTIDEALFERKCANRGIDARAVKTKLFDPARSAHARLRWLDSVKSVQDLVFVLGKPEDQVKDFIDLYQNSFREKEKLWKLLKMPGPMEERSSQKLVEAVMRYTLDSNALFCIHMITDWLYLADVWKGDPYDYRYNTPGTVGPDNWSMTMPLSLEEMNAYPLCGRISEMVKKSGR